MTERRGPARVRWRPGLLRITTFWSGAVARRWCMNRQTPQRFPNASIQSQALIEMDSGRTISVIRFRMLQAINASLAVA